MHESLIPPRFLFRYSVPCRRREPIWSNKGAELPAEFLLPALCELDGFKPFATLRAAWSPQGLAFSLRVEGKKQAPWCRETRPDESDGLRLFIDTRDTHNIHRAGRFCHYFFAMPTGGDRSLTAPVVEQILINRAKEHPRAIPRNVLTARREERIDGYLLDVFIPAKALTGFDPVEYARLGFTYAVVDREMGTQTFSCPTQFPYTEDPSLWGTLELVN